MASTSCIVAALSISLTALVAAHVLWNSRNGPAKEAHKLYEDRDGIATEESQKRYYLYLRIGKFVLLTLWAIGFSAALGASISRTAASENVLILESWLAFGAWVRTSTQNVYLSSLTDDSPRDLYLCRFLFSLSSEGPCTCSTQQSPIP